MIFDGVIEKIQCGHFLGDGVSARALLLLCRVLWILPPVFTASFLHPNPVLSPLGLDLLEYFLRCILVPSAIVLLYSMVLTTTSKPTFLPWSLFDYLSYY